MNSDLHPLHISDTMYSLEKIAYEPDKNIGFSTCISKIYELYDQVIEAYKSLDEEMEYLHIKRCLVLLKHAKSFKQFKKLSRTKVLQKYESLLLPRLSELKKSLELRYKKQSEERSAESMPIGKSLFSLVNKAEIRAIDPELSNFMKMAERIESNPKNHLINIGVQNTPYGDSLFTGQPITNINTQKPLYLAKTIGHLEHLSRQIPVPELEFESCIARMAYIIKLRKTVKENDLEMDFILLSRYLSLNENIRKLHDYHEKYQANRCLLIKVVTIKREYLQVKNLLMERYSSFANVMKLIERLTMKEKMFEAKAQGIKNRKAEWNVFINDGTCKK